MRTIFSAVLLSVGLAAQAATYSDTFTSFANGSTIYDGSLSGWADTRSVTMSGVSSITDVKVTLNFSGGYNGDIYAYLSHNGSTIVLLNRVGVSGSNPFGNEASGMYGGTSGSGVILTDGVNGNVHSYTGGGTYRPDGQAISPLSPDGSFNANGGGQTFANTFGGLDPNGTWTLFFADVVSGGGNVTMLNWSLDLTAVVPEPVNVALALFGVVAIGGTAGYRFLAARRRRA